MSKDIDDSILFAPGRIALGVEYMGARYSGWQRQREVPSVQAHIEQALSTVLQTPTEVTCAGRTDAGVHATGQVVHFDANVARPLKAYTRGLNTLLPKDIAITWACEVDHAFHARFSATARRYRYVIYNNALRSGVFNDGVTHVYQPLDATIMHEAAQSVVGEHDFTSFRASHCQSKTPRRHVHFIRVYQHQKFIIVDVKANAFLHHMVRNIVGALIKIGIGEAPVSLISDLLLIKDRTQAPATAKPNGLYLVKVDYQSQFTLGESDLGPLFLGN